MRTKIALAALALGLVISAWQLTSARVGEATNTVLHPTRRDISDRLRFHGSLVPTKTVDIKSRVSGIVDAVLVGEGDSVSAGDPLVVLDRTRAAAVVREAAAALREAQVQLALGQLRVDRDTPMLRERDGLRRRDLFGHGLVAVEDVEHADLEFAIARRRLQEQELTVRLQEAMVERALATLQRAETEAAYTTISAPIDGVVVALAAEAGSSVTSIAEGGESGTTLLTLGSSTASVALRVTSLDVVKLRLGMRARLDVPGLGTPVPAHVSAIGTRGETSSEGGPPTFAVRVALDFDLEAPRWNTVVAVELITRTARGALALPRSCIALDGAGPFVWVWSGGQRMKARIEVGIVDGDSVEVAGGLDPEAAVLGCRAS